MKEKTFTNSGKKDRPWIMRTYAGHTNAESSNRLFRENLKKGQTGLSIAFDLPTQTGYDSDHPLSEGEVGRVGVPVNHLGDMESLFDGIPLEEANTSMTINATAPWLLALYCAMAQRRGIDISVLKGTTQNDILKEYLSRGTYIFPPVPSIKLISDVIAYCGKNIPRWNPVNICSYHLQEAGATPVQEIAYALCNAITVLDSVRSRPDITEVEFVNIVGRISFFLNSGIRFVEEACKVRAFCEMWDDITMNRYCVKEDKLRRFRYGVQVNSLGLTSVQPENNVARIILEMLGVTLSRKARARAIQLPAWNEALGLPRSWDQQWSLRFQQILAYETDILEYEDIFDNSTVIESKVNELIKNTKKEMKKIESMGGAVDSIEYMKSSMVRSNTERIRSVESGDIKVVGVNCFKESENSPLLDDQLDAVQKVDPEKVSNEIRKLRDYKKRRDATSIANALRELQTAAENNQNIMEPSISCAHAGVTTGEWADTLRKVFGEYRAPTGINLVSASDNHRTSELNEKVRELNENLGKTVKILIAKPGLDGHSNGAEQIAIAAMQAGMDVLYHGIRLTPGQIVATALQEDVDIIGLSILSGSHIVIIKRFSDLMKSAGIDNIPVIAGGIIPESDIPHLIDMGIEKVYVQGRTTISDIVSDIVQMLMNKNRE